MQLRRYFAGYPSAEEDCQAFAADFATCLSVVASVANPLLPAKGIVQIGKEYARQRLSKIGGNLIALLCQHSLPAIALAKGLPDDCRQTICQLLPNCAGMICKIYNLQLEHC